VQRTPLVLVHRGATEKADAEEPNKAAGINTAENFMILAR